LPRNYLIFFCKATIYSSTIFTSFNKRTTYTNFTQHGPEENICTHTPPHTSRPENRHLILAIISFYKTKNSDKLEIDFTSILLRHYYQRFVNNQRQIRVHFTRFVHSHTARPERRHLTRINTVCCWLCAQDRK
jgi:hypothetical protein